MNNRIDMATSPVGFNVQGTSPFHSRESTPAPRTLAQTSYSSPEGLRPFLMKHRMKLLTIPIGLIGYGIAKLRQRQEQQRLQNEQVRKPIMHTIY